MEFSPVIVTGHLTPFHSDPLLLFISTVTLLRDDDCQSTITCCTACPVHVSVARLFHTFNISFRPTKLHTNYHFALALAMVFPPTLPDINHGTHRSLFIRAAATRCPPHLGPPRAHPRTVCSATTTPSFSNRSPPPVSIPDPACKSTLLSPCAGIPSTSLSP